MNKHEYERTKPMIWATFAVGALAARNGPADAAATADKMVAEFERRFPVEAEDDTR